MFVFVHSSYRLNLQIVLNTRTQKNKIKPPQKNPFQINFPIQKNSGIENLEPKTNPLIIPVTSLEIGSTSPPPPSPLPLGLTDRYCIPYKPGP